MRFGLWLYGLATIVTGILDLVWGKFETSHQPIQAFGGRMFELKFSAYLVGTLLVCAGVAILWKRTARYGTAAAAVIYLIFATLWLPQFFELAQQRGFGSGLFVFCLGGFASQLLFATPAAITYAVAASSQARARKATLILRWLQGVPPIAFGLGHLINLHAYVRFVPHWIPIPSFWVVLTGVAFLLAGVAVIAGVRDVLAVRLLALMLLAFEAAVEIPPVFAQPHNQAAWGGAIYNIAAIGVCCMFAALFYVPPPSTA